MAATMIERRPLGSGRPLPSGRVCRSLFGPVDHEETNRVLQREVARYKEEYKRKYNFDFDTDTPLPGLYDWRVDAPSAAPPVVSVIRAGAMMTSAPVSRLSAPVSLRLTINHPAALSSEGEEDEREPETPATPETPGSFGSSDESDYDSESPLERCIRRHNYDLRSIHPASTPDSTPIAATIAPITSALTTPSTPSTACSSSSTASSQHPRPVALYSPAKRVAEDVAECAPVSLDPIVEGCRSPADANASSQPRQTKITDFLRQRKRKLSAADQISKKILRGSPFRAANSAAAASPASPGLGFEAAAASTSVQ